MQRYSGHNICRSRPGRAARIMRHLLLPLRLGGVWFIAVTLLIGDTGFLCLTRPSFFLSLEPLSLLLGKSFSFFFSGSLAHFGFFFVANTLTLLFCQSFGLCFHGRFVLSDARLY